MSNDEKAQSNEVRRADQIIEMAAKGQTDKQIARNLRISENTVETYWRRLREQYGVPNRTAVVLARLRETVERQNHELREANAALTRAHAASREGMVSLLADTQKQLSAFRRGDDYLQFFERATYAARTVAYELESISPVLHRRLSASATRFNIDVSALEKAALTYYDIVYEEDLPLIYEKSLGATYAPDERYVFVYRLKMPEPRWVIDTHQAIHDANGFAGVIGIAVDVHDLVLSGMIRAEVSRITVPAEPLAATASLLNRESGT